ncbi:MAG: nucleotidyltransferase family protein [Candidatus Sumerlaeota bacterium]|nr:nucleotidyltransferase family protein [Candidatus Sumerlaeota bacterium]
MLNAIREKVGQFHTLGVKRLGLFGSFVRGEPSTKSDVDILVEFETGQKTFDHFIQLSFLLEEIFQRRVEIVTPESLSPHIGPHILREVEYVPIAA